MASCITSQWVSYAPQVRLTVTSSSTNTQTTLSWSLNYVASYPADASSRTWTVNIGGRTTTGSYNIDGVTGDKLISSGSETFSRGVSDSSVSCSVSFPFNLTWSGVYGGTKSASLTMSIPARPTYTVSYSANGGSGAPGSQTKFAGIALTLSSVKPTRTGYSFNNWLSTQGTVYAPGGTYSTDASTTMTARWTANTYTISYNANGGSGEPLSQTKTYGVDLTISSVVPTRTNYNFLGWSTTSWDTIALYQPGEKYTYNASATLYAVWELAHVLPTIENLTVERCDSDGTLNDEGVYVVVNFDWTTDKPMTSILIEWFCTSGSSSTGNELINPSGTVTSGSVTNKVIGSGVFAVEHDYRVVVTVTDEVISNSKSMDVPKVAYTMDFLAGGTGVRFGGPAERDGVDFDMNVYIRSDKHLYREVADGSTYEMLVNKYYDVYPGIALHDGTDTGYIRTTSSGLLPYNSAVTSRIGTSAWPFMEGYFSSIRWSDTSGGYRDICTNKVLWSGAYWMREGQTATFSEAISKQPTGVIFVWSKYSSGAQDYAWNTIFVPKEIIRLMGSCGFSFLLSEGCELFAGKYLYISDTHATGYAANDDAPYTYNNFPFYNNYFCLRYVIGV